MFEILGDSDFAVVGRDGFMPELFEKYLQYLQIGTVVIDREHLEFWQIFHVCLQSVVVLDGDNDSVATSRVFQ